MKRILLARHGVTWWNLERRFQGCSDVPLAEEGHAQARRLAARVAPWNPDRIVCSPLVRARETAETVRNACGTKPRFEEREGFREMSFGFWEGLAVERLLEEAGDELGVWHRDPGSYTPPGGESFSEAQDRALKTLREVLEGGPAEERLLVVAHGGILTALLLAFFGMPSPVFRSLLPGNCALSAIHTGPEFRFLVFLNDTLHMAVPEALVGDLPIPA